MDTNPEELQIEVVFSRLCQGMVKVLQNYYALYLTSVIIHINDKTDYKSHSLKLGLLTLN